jgi:hypothetical protein
MTIKLDEDYNIPTSDTQLLHHIVWNNHAKMYQVTLQMIKREMANAGKKISLEDVIAISDKSTVNRKLV